MLLMGSHYWNTNNKNSDEDYIDYITPTKEDLYNQNLLSKSVIGEDKDINYKDIRMLTKELAKGSLISFQVLYSNGSIEDDTANKCLSYARENKDDLFKELKPYLQKSILGELKGTASNIFKERNKLENQIDKKKLNKNMANATKLYFLLEILKEDTNPFIEWFKSDKYSQIVLAVKEGRQEFISIEDILSYLEGIGDLEKISLDECKTYQKVKNKFIEIIFDSYKGA